MKKRRPVVKHAHRKAMIREKLAKRKHSCKTNPYECWNMPCDNCWLFHRKKCSHPRIHPNPYR